MMEPFSFFKEESYPLIWVVCVCVRVCVTDILSESLFCRPMPLPNLCWNVCCASLVCFLQRTCLWTFRWRVIWKWVEGLGRGDGSCLAASGTREADQFPTAHFDLPTVQQEKLQLVLLLSNPCPVSVLCGASVCKRRVSKDLWNKVT